MRLLEPSCKSLIVARRAWTTHWLANFLQRTVGISPGLRIPSPAAAPTVEPSKARCAQPAGRSGILSMQLECHRERRCGSGSFEFAAYERMGQRCRFLWHPFTTRPRTTPARGPGPRYLKYVWPVTLTAADTRIPDRGRVSQIPYTWRRDERSVEELVREVSNPPQDLRASDRRDLETVRRWVDCIVVGVDRPESSGLYRFERVTALQRTRPAERVLSLTTWDGDHEAWSETAVYRQCTAPPNAHDHVYLTDLYPFTGCSLHVDTPYAVIDSDGD